MADIAVIGSGVIGISAAYQLSEAGHSVTLISESAIGGVTSQTSFAWVNSNSKNPEDYHRLNVLGMRQHAQLQQRVAPPVKWFVISGCILEPSTVEEHESKARHMTERRYPVVELESDDLAVLAPQLAAKGGKCLYFPTEGILHVNHFIEQLWSLLLDSGATAVQKKVSAVDSDESQARVTFEGGQQMAFDHVFLALGKRSHEVSINGDALIPMLQSKEFSDVTHCFLGYTSVGSQLLSQVYISESINIRPDGESGLIVQAPALEYLLNEPNPEAQLDKVRSFMEEELESTVISSGEARIKVNRVIIAERSLPADGYPILGLLDDWSRVSTAVSHSGVTLSALYGALAVSFAEGAEPDIVKEFKLSRFENKTSVNLYRQQGVGRQ